MRIGTFIFVVVVSYWYTQIGRCTCCTVHVVHEFVLLTKFIYAIFGCF